MSSPEFRGVELYIGEGATIPALGSMARAHGLACSCILRVASLSWPPHPGRRRTSGRGPAGGRILVPNTKAANTNPYKGNRSQKRNLIEAPTIFDPKDCYLGGN